MVAPKSRLGQQRDYRPTHWSEYFDEAHDVVLDETNKFEPITDEDIPIPSESRNSFRVYLKNFQPPYSPARTLGQTLDASQLDLPCDELKHYSNIPTLVTLHGGGYSALTWCEFTHYIEQYCQCRIMSLDLRSHGDTKTADPNRMDIDTLVSDVISVSHAAHRICGFLETPKIILIGHSMGGAIAVKCAAKCTESLPSLAGFVVIDVVEGTAKDALPLMMSVIKTRPTKFPSLDNAIEWSVRSGMAKNVDAAKVSMPGNLINLKDGRLGIHDVKVAGVDKTAQLKKLAKHCFRISLDQLIIHGVGSSITSPKVLSLRHESPTIRPPNLPRPSATIDSPSPIIEEDESEYQDDMKKQASVEHDDVSEFKSPPEIDQSGYGWRTNLAKTQQFWNGWFEGLSGQLLDAPVQGKFLLLAGIDRLDRALTIGQMQGKFMMKVLPKCGHAVHEDVPEQVATSIADFLIHNKFTKANE